MAHSSLPAFDDKIVHADLGFMTGGAPLDYWRLLKPRVMSLVVFTGFVGLLVAPGAIHPVLAFVAVLAIALASGGAGVINMWYDRDIDAVMERTKNRPIPAGRILPESAFIYGMAVIGVAVALMGLATNWFAALLLGFAAFFYIVIYTIWLKRSTSQNIVIGGAAGAFPPMIGWAAVTGNVSWDAFILFSLIFIWTPPHFWALALFRSDDYEKANIPMLPVTAGHKHTKWQMLFYCVLLIPLSVAPFYTGLAGMIYGVGACLLSLIFLLYSVVVLYSNQVQYQKQMFFYSIFYLFALFALLMLDHAPAYWLG